MVQKSVASHLLPQRDETRVFGLSPLVYCVYEHCEDASNIDPGIVGTGYPHILIYEGG